MAKATDGIATAFATWFGCGLSPKAPGTVGSLGALPFPWLLAVYFPNNYFLILSACLGALIALGIWSTNHVIRITGIKDPQRVVIDEVAGIWVACLFLSAQQATSWLWLALAFAGFRLFDITKILGVRRLEGLTGAWGVMADDLLAGVYAGLVLLSIAILFTP